MLKSMKDYEMIGGGQRHLFVGGQLGWVSNVIQVNLLIYVQGHLSIYLCSFIRRDKLEALSDTIFVLQ